MQGKIISIIGVGLIGGSIGKAIRNSRLKIKNLIGVGRHIEKLKLAKKLGAIDEYTTDFVKGIKNADIVIVATPVNTIVPIVKKILPYLKSDCIITDVGSVKFPIVSEIYYPNFIGSHPMAGSEKTGVRFSSSEIFKNSTVVITPSKNTS
ncbi:MAG: prephenate dehydrogenase, partial [Endomicrobiia bacterium]